MKKLISFGFLLTSIAAFAINPGDKAPDFGLMNEKGELVKLADFKEKIIVLEWYNEDCPYVRKHYDTDNMQNTQKEFKDNKEVVWLTITSSAPGKQGYIDGPKAAKKRIAEDKMNSTHLLLDPKGDVGKAYGAKTTPHMYVIGKTGLIEYVGAIDSERSANPDDVEKATNYAKSAIKRVLAGKKANPQKTNPYGCSVKY